MVEKIRDFVQQHYQLMILMLFAFFLALLVTGGIYVQTDMQLAEVAKQQELLKEEKKAVLRKLAAVEVEASTLRNSQLAMRQTIEKLQSEVAEQDKALDFYRQLMTADGSKKGLELNSYLLKQLDEPNLFFYRFTFVQYAKKHLALKADLSITVEGEHLSEKTSYDFRKLVATNDNQFGKLRFKYFQVVEGHIKLPEGFVPEQLIIDAQLNTKKPKAWQRKLSWAVEES